MARKTDPESVVRHVSVRKLDRVRLSNTDSGSTPAPEMGEMGGFVLTESADPACSYQIIHRRCPDCTYAVQSIAWLDVTTHPAHDPLWPAFIWYLKARS